MSSAAIRRMVAVLGTGVLGVFLLSTPVLAGPGNGHQQSSNGSTQGASHSNPDGGGVDKPYAAAGQEARSQGDADWDGNNGCGNDDDREDDNNGWCGRKPDHERSAHAADVEAASVKASGVKASGVKASGVKASGVKASGVHASGVEAAQVMGVQVEAAAATTTAAAAPAPAAVSAAGRGTEVLGVQVTRGETLAATGLPIAPLVLVGVALIIAGVLLSRGTWRHAPSST